MVAIIVPLWNPLPTSPPRAPAGTPLTSRRRPSWWLRPLDAGGASLIAWPVPLTRSSSSGRSSSSSRAGSSSGGSCRTCRLPGRSVSRSSPAPTSRPTSSNVVARVAGSGAGRSSSARSLLALALPGRRRDLRHRWLAPLQRPTFAGSSARAPGRPPGLDRRCRGRPRRPRRPRHQRLGRDARRLGQPAAGTGATSWSTSRSARASRPATSRRRCPTSRACR